jgi:4-amino-4-deoxy-L-arabinose transferase-like glycosyltransferase
MAAGPAALAVVFAWLTHLSWRRWSDVQVDVGRELYASWALASGQTLYLDVADKNGPLPFVVNALWFRLFGDSFTTLALCNLALLALFTALVYGVCRRSTDRWTATLAAAVLLGVFGFAHPIQTGNYNFVTPYNHTQTHGVILGTAAVACLGRWLRTGRGRWAAGAGILAGLVFLTKAELFVPVAGAALLAIAFAARRVVPAARTLRGVALLVLSSLAPPLLFTAALASRMPLALAGVGVLGNWGHLGGGVLDDPFYRAGMGLDDSGLHLLSMLRVTGVVALGLIVGAGADRWLRPAVPMRGAWLVGSGALALVLLRRLVPLDAWLEGAYALPPICAVALAAGLWLALRRQKEGGARLPGAALALWSVFALGLLGKLGLQPRFIHYGFALALPATLLAITLAVGVAPGWLRRAAGGGELFRALASAVVLAFFLALCAQSALWYSHKTLAVAEGADTIYVEPPPGDPRGLVVSLALKRLGELMPPGATLAVLPEGAFLNYWLRSANPTPFVNLTPQEFAAASGEEAVLARFERTPPDFVVLVDRDGTEFGVGAFGADERWGKGLLDWVRGAYEPVVSIGPPPFSGRGFGLTILRRRPAPS